MSFNCLLLVTLFVNCICVHVAVAQASLPQKGDENFRPKLFKQFSDLVNVPDGMTQDTEGNFYVAGPNLVNMAYPGVIMKLGKKSKKWEIFVAAAAHPETKKGFPMGLEFGEDGNLYYADNQYFVDKNYKSRLMRVVIDKQGNPVRIETVVENVKLTNAVRCRGDAVFFTDTFFDLKDKHAGGLYRVPFSAFAKGPVKLLNKEESEKDPYCIGITYCNPHHRKDIAATDGMCFDKQGNIYTGNFGDGHFYTLKLQPNGTYGKPLSLVQKPQELPCVDGVNYYEKKNWVIIADSERNALVYWDIDAAKLGLLWINGDTDGAEGLLDQPCECMVWNNQLIISNFDVTFPGLKNSTNDPIHTLSVMKLP